MDLEDGEPDINACVALWVRVENGYLLRSRIVVGRSIDDVFGLAFNGGQVDSVESKRRCRMKIEPASYSAHSARVIYVQAAGHQAAQGF